MLVRLAGRRRRTKVLRARVSSGAGDCGESILPSLTVCEEYRLRPFPVPIVHFLAGDLRVSTQVLTDPRRGWADFAAGGLEEHYLAGDHASLFTESQVPALAAQIQKAIDAVGNQSPKAAGYSTEPRTFASAASTSSSAINDSAGKGLAK
jgi:hypothetical protein